MNTGSMMSSLIISAHTSNGLSVYISNTAKARKSEGVDFPFVSQFIIVCSS
jgi:hypothetical protein